MSLRALCFPLITVGIEFSPHIMFATLRALIAGFALLALALWLIQPPPRGYGAWAGLAAIGLGVTTRGILGMFHTAEFVEPGAVTVIANTQPLLAALLAGLLLGERSSGRAKKRAVHRVCGRSCNCWPAIFSGGKASYMLGIGCIILATLGISVSNLLIKKASRKIDGLLARSKYRTPDPA